MEFYQTEVLHKRLINPIRAFSYTLDYCYFDVQSKILPKFFSINKRNLYCLYEKNYLTGDTLWESIQTKLKQEGVPPAESIFLLTLPQTYKIGFNPVNFWYCYKGKKIYAIIVEVKNTFLETHPYTIHNNGLPLDFGATYKINKVFYVSPFLEIKGFYKFKFEEPSQTILVNIQEFQDDKVIFFAQLKGIKVDFSYSRAFKTLFFNFITGGTVWLFIHWQALILWIKKTKYYSHIK